jgi:hypothetical protein
MIDEKFGGTWKEPVVDDVAEAPRRTDERCAVGRVANRLRRG